MAYVYRSAHSQDDYRTIWLFIATDNPEAADKLLRTIDEKLATYSENPRMGTVREKLGHGLRSFPVGNYLVFYRIVPDGIELVRVLHGMRNIKTLLGKDSPPR